jgi:putative Holliday junction resolvase
MAGYVLAFDFGTKHIGVAVGQTITCTATAVTTLRAKRGQPQWSDVDKLLEQWQPSHLLVGLPLNMDGSESDMSGRARGFARHLQAHTALEVSLVDERLTSYEAKTVDAGDNHAIAAMLIAQTWLNEQALNDDS